MQRLFDRLRWNTSYVIENLAGVYIPENDSYNGNIGLLERNQIDMYFTPNIINVFTRRIGLSQPVTTNELILMQIVDQPAAQLTSDITQINLPLKYWAINLLNFACITLLMTFILLKSYLFLFKYLNKKYNGKTIFNFILTGSFYAFTLFAEQLKSQDKSQSLIRFLFSFIYLGVWFWNRLLSGLMQTEAFKIDTSKIIYNLDQTFKSSYQACLLVNEPMTYDFLEGKKKIFSSMFASKPRHIYQADLNDILNFMRNHLTRVFIATSPFIKGVSWSICEFFRDEMGDRKVFIPKFIVDENIAVYYYNLKSSKKVLNDIIKILSVAVIENSLITYQRNPHKLNLLDSDVQNFCVVQNLKLLEEASMRTAELDHQIKLDSYLRFMIGYFIIITCILLVALIISSIHFIKIKLSSRKEEDPNLLFAKKLGSPLADEIVLEQKNLNSRELDRLYVNVDTINKLIESAEFNLHFNPFQIHAVNEEYQLMRLKYKRLRLRIKKLILKKDGQIDLSFKLENDILINQFQNLKRIQDEKPISRFIFKREERENSHLVDDYMVFKYSLPNNLNRIVNKYNANNNI